jgi:hypothetical protein
MMMNQSARVTFALLSVLLHRRPELAIAIGRRPVLVCTGAKGAAPSTLAATIAAFARRALSEGAHDGPTR